MELYIGGSYQGKLEYVLKKCRAQGKDYITETDIYNGNDYPLGDVTDAKIIFNYHRLIKRLLDAGEDVSLYTERIVEHSPDIIIICDEVGMGIIPNEQEAVNYREAVGNCTCMLAQKADSVVRIICGLAQKIK